MELILPLLNAQQKDFHLTFNQILKNIQGMPSFSFSMQLRVQLNKHTQK